MCTGSGSCRRGSQQPVRGHVPAAAAPAVVASASEAAAAAAVAAARTGCCVRGSSVEQQCRHPSAAEEHGDCSAVHPRRRGGAARPAGRQGAQRPPRRGDGVQRGEGALRRQARAAAASQRLHFREEGAQRKGCQLAVHRRGHHGGLEMGRPERHRDGSFGLCSTRRGR